MERAKLKKALEIDGKAAHAEIMIQHVQTLLDIAANPEAKEVQLSFALQSKDCFTIPLLKGMIETFQNQRDRYNMEFDLL